MSTANKATRVIQAAVLSLGGGLFNGNVEAVLIPVDTKNLKFTANLKVFTGDTTTPFVEYTPANANGTVKTFANVDDCVKWVNGAYQDVSSFKAEIVDFSTIAKAFVPPTDPVKDATAKKAKFTKLKADALTMQTAAAAQVAAAAASGWNLPTAHASLQAKYAEFAKQKGTIDGAIDYYTARITYYNGIINPS